MNRTVPPETTRTVPALLAQKADRHGTKTMMEFEDQSYTYSEWERRTRSFAAGLQSLGVEKGDHVAIFGYNSPEWLLVGWAAAILGATVVPVDTRFKENELEYVLAHCDADVIVFDSHTREAYEKVRDAIAIDTELYIGQEESAPSYQPVNDFIHRGSLVPIAGTISPDDPLTITYVQRQEFKQPVGVVLPHFAFINTGWELCNNILNLSTDDKVFTTLPMYSCFSQHASIIGPMLVDASFAFAWRFEPEEFWDQVRSHKATVVVFLGRMLSVLSNQESTPSDSDNPIEYAVGFGTDEILIDEFEPRFGCEILECYGVEETASLATANRPTEKKQGSIGVPLSYTEVEVVNENDRPVSTGNIGEIVTRPTRPFSMMLGYYKEPKKTLRKYRNLWVHTGDLGYKDEDGYFHYIGEEQTTIRRLAGEVSSLEIKSVLESHQDVAEAAVVGTKSPSGVEDIKAILVPEADASISPPEVIEYCEKKLRYKKLPRYLSIVDSMPRTASGKLKYKTLKQLEIDWDREAGYEYTR